MSRFLKKVSGVLAAGALAMVGTFVTAPTAGSAVRAGVTVNYVEGGGAVNCKGGDTCVEKVGDTAEVEWTVQVTNAYVAYSGNETYGRPVILVPEVVKNLSVTIDALPDQEAFQPNLWNHPDWDVWPTSYPVQEVKKPGQVVLDANSSEAQALTNDLDDDTSQWGIYKDDNVFSADLAEVYPSDEPWDAYVVPFDGTGVVTLTLKGEVTVESEDTYIPIRVTNSTGPCVGDGCKEFYYNPWEDGYGSWGLTGALPEFSLTDPEVNARVADLQSPQGRLGTPECSPTSETGDYGKIGWDNLQQMKFDRPKAYYQAYVNQRDGSTYVVSGFNAYEDWCDQADFHITICDQADEEVPPSEEPSTTPSTEESSQPSEPEESSQPSEPEVSDEPEESTAVSTPKDETPNNENGEETNPTPESQAQAQAEVNTVSNGSKQQTAQQQGSPQARNLPVTGSSTGLLVAGGVALLGVIAGGVYYATRRKSANE